jgi:hypothetical protein
MLGLGHAEMATERLQQAHGMGHRTLRSHT